MTADINIPVGSSAYSGSYLTMDLQPSPVNDGTVALVRGTPGPGYTNEDGGVQIYDDGTLRPNVLCGDGQIGCMGNGAGDELDSIQWNPTATEMFALDANFSPLNFYSVPVTSSGFGAVTNYGSLPSAGDKIHYDAPTGLLYTDSGVAINPAMGTVAGTFSVSGPAYTLSPMLGIPDGNLGYMFFLEPPALYSTTYVLSWYDIKTFAQVGSVQIKGVNGTANHLIRWGSNGIAFSTTGCVVTAPCAVYIVNPIL